MGKSIASDSRKQQGADKMKKLKLQQIRIYEVYYILVMLGYFLTMFTTQMHPGVFAAVLLLCIAVELLCRKQVEVNTTIDYLVVLYLLYNLLSVIWLKASGLPVIIYVEEFSNSMLPIVFYMVGRTVSVEIEKFYKWLLAGIFSFSIVGLIMYITAPQIFLDYLMRMQFISLADASTMRIRMTSLIGSTSFGYLSVCGMFISAWFLAKEKKRTVGFILFFMNGVFAFLSNQRSAMVAAIIVFAYVNYLIFFVLKMIRKKYLFWEVGGIAVAFCGLSVLYFDAILKVYHRLISLPGAIGQRSEQWVVAVNTLYSNWLGNGLGANGHKALGYEGTHVIADGGLVKLFCEEGAIGFSIFLFILLIIFSKCGRCLKECYVEIGIISITILQSIGSNMLSFQLTTPIFWFAVGRCAYLLAMQRQEYVKQEKKIEQKL